MKADYVKIAIALTISALVAYLCFWICDCERVETLLTAGSCISVTVPLVCSLGFSNPEYPRGSAMMKLTAAIFAVLMIVENILFSFCDFTVAPYIITLGLSLILFLLIYISVYRARQ